jgi:hypothetical protein
MPAGARDDSGKFPVESINEKVEACLLQFARNLHDFENRDGKSNGDRCEDET